MGRMIIRQLVGRRGRTLALLAGIALATTAFTVLTAASKSEQLRVRGTVARNYRSTYDLLVRPSGARTVAERQSGLVQPNAASGLFGGITMDQVRTVARVPGVTVAAPVGVIGYVLPELEIKLPLPPRAGRVRRRELFRVRLSWSLDRGLTRIRDANSYLWITPRTLSYPFGIQDSHGVVPLTVEVQPDGSRKWVCPYQLSGPGARSPFAASVRTRVDCWSLRTGDEGSLGGRPRQPTVSVPFPVPLLVAAIDPRAEARLDGLDRAVVSGRYLRAGEATQFKTYQHRSVGSQAAPVLTSTRAFADETAHVTVQALSSSVADRIPGIANPAGLQRLLKESPSVGRVVRRTVDASRAYNVLLGRLRRPVDIESYWSAAPERFTQTPRGALIPRVVVNRPSVWTSRYSNVFNGFVDVPEGERDPQFRSLTEHLGDNNGNHSVPSLQAVGRFDPNRIPGFTRPGDAPLGSYQAPVVTGADAAARRLLGDRSLLPDGGLTGPVQSPPLLLTTFAALPMFADSNLFANTTGAISTAPVSSIRVRVAGVTGPDALSRERLRFAAQQIAKRTGLTVDLTTGSSPVPVTLALPAGHHGRPQLMLSQLWPKKGVAVALLRATDRKSVALFVLILIVCTLFCANAAAAGVRTRSTELAVLAGLGWRSRSLFALVLGELAATGLAAGLIGAVLALPIAAVLGLSFAASHALLAIPAATLLCLLAGLRPAIRAARTPPIRAARPAVTSVRTHRAARSVRALALSNVVRLPGRSLLGAVSLAVGILALTFLLAITLVFHGAVVGSLLGNAVALQVRTADVVAVAATVTLGALAVADVLYLNVRERTSELATLQAIGWPDGALTRLIMVEGLVIGVTGAVLGAGLGLVGAIQFAGRAPGNVFAIAALAIIIGTLLTAAAAVLPATLARRLPVAQALAEE